MSGAPARAVTLRATSSVVTFSALAVVAAVFVGDALIRGRLALALRAAALLALGLWVAWVFLIRLSVRVEPDALVAQNALSWVRMPWGRIADIERRAQLRVTLDDGRAVECWGSPFAPRSGWRRGPVVDAALQTVRAAWQDAHSTDAAVTRGWDVPALIAGGILVVCAAAALVPW